MKQEHIIPWLTRPDLESVLTGAAAQSQIVVKDQVRNEFFHFGEVEFFILESLKQRTSAERLQVAVERRFGVRLSIDEIEAYVHRLAGDNLLVAMRLGDGERLYHQFEKLQRSQWTQGALGILSVKFPGFHPGGLLRLLSVPGWFLFHPITIALVMAAALATLGFALLSLDVLSTKVPSFAELTDPVYLALMLIGFVMVKILHELGHGLSCQRSGRECNEMGILLLVGIPCMYCDVSDMWTQPSRWQRIMVSLAGVFVEVAISVVCFWGWYGSVDGTLHSLLFGMMLITSVNTLFVNGNPLMRYDGYYALSDFLEIPNLANAAKELFQQRLLNLFVVSESTFLLNQKSKTLMTYATLANVYRVMIMFAIGWAAWTFFEGQQLKSIGSSLVILLVVLTLVPIAMSFQKFAGAAWKQGLRISNVTIAVVLLVVIWLCLANIQFSYRVYGSAEIELADAKHLFAPADGQLKVDVMDGQSIESGEPIAEIIDDELRLEIVVAQNELEEMDVRLQALAVSERNDAAGEIEFWNQRKSTLVARLEKLKQRFSELKIVSPKDGIIIARKIPLMQQSADDAALPVLSGSRFEPRNAGSHVTRGETLCYIADPGRSRGYLKVDESEIEFVKINQTVRIYVPHTARSIAGTVTRISLESEQETEAINMNSSGDPIRFFRVEFDFESDFAVRVGATHWAVIECETMTPLDYLSRWWQTSFWY
ncbi:MAG: HlyD family efflux transporter periplasmic adaptor subunit [Planctomycetota bacterium]